jgi:hypothetical protein
LTIGPALGIDPGVTAGGVGVVEGGVPVLVGWYERLGLLDGYRATRASSVGLDVAELASLADALLWLVPVGRGPAAVEAIHAGQPSGRDIAGAARVAIAALRRHGWGPASRPRPEVWRGAYHPQGRRVAASRDDAKRLALAALYDVPAVGAPWLVRSGRPAWLPDGVPDHAAEAVGMARWASHTARRGR